MSTPIATRRVVVSNPQGIHARPSGQLVKTAGGFASDIVVRNLSNGAEANAKFLLEVMTLIATKGSELEFEARGDDADAAVAALAALVESGFGES
ncbi:MAG: HPr family phosphocarrier protein [Planctomycetota bacterium]